MLFYPYNYNNQKNTIAISKAVEKLKNRSISVDQILDDEDLLNDLKYPSNSQIINQ